VPPGTLTDSTWGGPLAPAQTPLAEAFVASLRDIAAFDALLPNMLRLPVNTRIAIVTAGAAGSVVNEGQVKPTSQLALANADLVPVKAVCFVVVTRELMEIGGPGADALMRRELSGAVASTVDTAFVSALTVGLTPIPSAGGTALGVRADLRALVDAVDTGAGSKLYFLTTSFVAKRLAVLGDAAGGPAFPTVNASSGGNIGGIPIVISDGVPSANLVLVDAAQIAAASNVIELDKSDTATLNLDNLPSPPTASTPYISLFSQNMTALRATRYFAVKRLRDTAVAVVSNVTATGNSPA
jgi:HK97 family phage major capsid protein